MEIQETEQLRLVSEIKDKIKNAQYKALLNVNEQLIKLYWEIGNDLNENTAYGNKFIDSLAQEIKLSFPGVKGYSARNLRYTFSVIRKVWKLPRFRRFRIFLLLLLFWVTLGN